MYISRIALDHYRSWEHCVVDLDDGVNILNGANGLGKTNIVEAVEVLSTGGSHRASSSIPLIERGHSSATVRVNVRSDAADGGPADVRETTYEMTISARGANRARINGGSSMYMREIIGRVPSISFTPEDQHLVTGDPAARRNLLNQAGALLIPGYAERLQTVRKIAKQRSTLLKQLAERDRYAGSADAALSGLEIWTGQFIESGVALTRDRRRLVDRLSEPFSDIYRQLSGGGRAALAYEPSFEEVLAFDDPALPISEHFQRIYPGEVARGANLIGPHRDDLGLLLEDAPAREYASNGEMWTLALALKMALFDVVAADQGTRPIVILDDVFAQLDDSRRTQILDFARAQQQVLITVAAAGDVPDLHGITANVIDVAALKRAQDEYLHPDLSDWLPSDSSDSSDLPVPSSWPVSSNGEAAAAGRSVHERVGA